MAIADPPLGGTVAPGWEPVRDEFVRNLRERGDIGAACAVYVDGEAVVDLWGGWRDRESRAPWQRETQVLVYSATKGMAALCLAVAHSRGLIDYDERVSTYWPEFAQHGKGDVTVRQLLRHEAGIPAVDEPLTPALLADHDALAAVVARQRPAWPPGSAYGYHYLTLGFCENELLRRVDPQRRSLGRFLRDEIMTPLGGRFTIGRPVDAAPDDYATIYAFKAAQMALHMYQLPWRMVLAYMRPGSLTARTMGNPKFSSPGDMGRPPYAAVELASGNGVGEVRAMARAFGAAATGGEELGLGEATLAELTRPVALPARRDRCSSSSWAGRAASSSPSPASSSARAPAPSARRARAAPSPTPTPTPGWASPTPATACSIAPGATRASRRCGKRSPPCFVSRRPGRTGLTRSPASCARPS